MFPANDFSEFIRKVRAGDQEAAQELFRRFEPHLRRVTRVRLENFRLRRVLDSIGTADGSVYWAYLSREQADLLSIQVHRANQAASHRRRGPQVVLEKRLV